MCISTAYRNKIGEENIIMKNVMSVQYLNGKVVLTDLMEHKREVPGTLKEANLVDNYIIIEEPSNV